jgi:hypothetical protein
VRGVPRRVGDGPAHPGALPSTQSRRVWATISMIVRTPRPGLADELAPGLVELDLARGVGAVAELVLQALQAERVAGAVLAGRAGRGSTRRPRRSARGRGRRRTSARCRTTCGR